LEKPNASLPAARAARPLLGAQQQAKAAFHKLKLQHKLFLGFFKTFDDATYFSEI
jgi:hypothetical protein